MDSQQRRPSPPHGEGGQDCLPVQAGPARRRRLLPGHEEEEPGVGAVPLRQGREDDHLLRQRLQPGPLAQGGAQERLRAAGKAAISSRSGLLPAQRVAQGRRGHLRGQAGGPAAGHGHLKV